jgi:hypothetical protein
MNISSSPTSPRKYLFKSTPAVRRAADTLLTSITCPSSSLPCSYSVLTSFLTSVKRATTVLSAVPAVSADSRVVSIIYAKNAEVVSKSILALCANDATFVIAVEISSTLEADIAANFE